MTEPRFQITPKKYNGESSVVSMRMPKDMLKDIDEIAKTFNIPVLARIPMQEETSRAVDAGDIESLDIPELKDAAETVEKLLKK